MNYRHLGRQKTASFGPYPSVSLAEAREHREEPKRVLRSGMDPVEHAQATKEAPAKALRAQEDVTTPTFEALSLSFIAKHTHEKASHKTLEKYDWLHRLTLPEIGHLNPMEIEPPDLRALLLRLESENKLDTAQRTRTYIGQVMRHGIAASLASRDPRHRRAELPVHTVHWAWQGFVRPYCPDLIATPDAFDPDVAHQSLDCTTG